MVPRMLIATGFALRSWLDAMFRIKCIAVRDTKIPNNIHVASYLLNSSLKEGVP